MNITEWRRVFRTHRGISAAILIFNAILIGVMWYTVLQVIRVEREDTVRAAIERNDNLALAFEHYVTRTIESADSAIRYLIREYARVGHKMDVRQFVAENTVDSSLFVGIAMVNEHGNGLTTTALGAGETVRQVTMAERDFFRELQARDSDKLLIGKPVAGRVKARMIIPIARRYNKADGSFGGVVAAFIEPARLTELFDSARMRQLDTVALLGLDGITRARLKDMKVSAGEDVSKGRLFVERARNPYGNYYARGLLDTVPKFFSYRALPDYDLISLVGAAESDVLADFERRRTRYLSAAGLATLTIAGFILLLLRVLSEQQRAAAGSARSQARFLATFNQAAVGISHTRLDGRFMDVNQKLCDILGYSRAELMTRHFAELTHPDDVAANNDLRKRLLDAAADNASTELEKRYIRKDGTTVWCVLSISVVCDDAGRPEYFAAMIQDITDRKRAQNTLMLLEQEQRQLARRAQEERTRLADAQSVAKIGSWETEFSDFSVIWSEETYRIFECDPLHFRPTHAGFLAFVHADDRAQVDAAFAVSLQQQSPGVIEHRIVMADGRIKMVEERWRIVRDEQGHAVRAVGTCQDITERKRGETALRESEERFRQLAENIEEVYWLTDAVKQTMLYISPAYEAVWGRSEQSLYVSPLAWLDAIHPEDRQRITEAVKSKQTAGTYDEEYRIVRPDGGIRWVRDRAFPVRDAAGAVYRIAGVVTDISKEKQAETALKAYADYMRYLSRRLSEVEETERRNINRELHDRIGPNLVALKLNLQMMRSRLSRELLGAMGAQIDDAQKVLDATNKQLRNVMADLRPPALDDYGLLAALRTYAEPYAFRIGIPVNVAGDAITPRPPLAVETALFRIAQEALNNIAKHAEARQVNVSLQADTQRIVLTIADDGAGFDVEHAEAKPDGWGLKTMRERATAIGASFRIDSAPGSGTRVTVELLRDAA
jgi:PAS domain S-box-containing protein